MNVRGRYGEAYRVLSEGLAIATELWTDGAPGTAAVLNALGNCLYYQAAFDEAERHYTMALALRDRLLPPLDPAIGTSLNNLATVRLYKGVYSEAEKLYERALLHRETRQKGPSHPDVATTACNIANLYHAQGRFDLADGMYLRIRRSASTSPEFLTGWVLTNYAELRLDQRQPEAAREMLTDALDIFRQTTGMEVPVRLDGSPQSRKGIPGSWQRE